ncbi:hypothetical protein [Carnimonas nigrificans]|nr:hypothetical protein [Carnimonas nigrificans]
MPQVRHEHIPDNLPTALALHVPAAEYALIVLSYAAFIIER